MPLQDGPDAGPYAIESTGARASRAGERAPQPGQQRAFQPATYGIDLCGRGELYRV